jgi:TetR/AcrR family transcriptional regulator
MPEGNQPKSAPSNRSVRARDAEQTRERLLVAAERVFTKVGFDGARVDDIAKCAGANKRMLYVYFGDKEGLYRQVLRSAFLRITQRPRPQTPDEDSPRNSLESWIRGYFDFLGAHPGLVRLVEWDVAGDGSRSASAVEEVAQQEILELTELLQRGIEVGQFRRDIEPSKVLMAIHALCFGILGRVRLWSSLWKLELGKPTTLESVGNFIATMVLDGIGVEASVHLAKGSTI